MKILDGKRAINLPDDDPVVARIRALLYRQPDRDPVQSLWNRVSGPLRAVLVTIAAHGDIAQPNLEVALGVDGVGLRGRHAALARVAKTLGVDYPIRKTGGRRENRRFSLEPGTAEAIRRLAGLEKSHNEGRGMTMKHITDATFANAIASQGKIFDTHDVIRRVMQIAPREYADELGETGGNDPILTLHAQIGKHLLTIAAIEPTKKVVSVNIRGQENENQQWRTI